MIKEDFNYKNALIREIYRDKRSRYTLEYLEELNEWDLKELLADLQFQIREDI
jgi:hypothetical protein